MLKFTKFMPKLLARCLMVVVYKCNNKMLSYRRETALQGAL